MEQRSAQSPPEPPSGQSTSAPAKATPKGNRAQGQQGQSDPQVLAAAMMVERLATFLKACFIYPDNNQRVQITGGMVLESLRALFARRPLLEIVVGSHDLVVCGIRLPMRSHAQSWLRDLFVKSLIGGLEFTPAADIASLTASARRLQRSQIGKERGMLVWSDPIPGVRARELIMSGSHGEGGAEADAPADTTLSGSRGARSRALEATLAASARVQERLEALRALLPEGDRQDGSSTLDVISELVQCLPAEANHDHAYAEALAEKIIESTRLELERLAGDAPIERNQIAAAFLSIGQKLFTATVAKDMPTPHVGRGHGDETISDSLEDLLRDLDKLAADMSKVDESVTAGTAAEVIGVVLHTMTQAEGLRDEALLPQLLAALQGGDEGASKVLAQYFEVALSSEDADQRPTWRIVNLARQPLVRQALASTRLLEPEQVAAHFPRTFGFFLDSLRDADDGAARLGRLVRLIAAERLAAAPAWFDRHPEDINEARIDNLFAAMSPRALALAALAVRCAKHDVKAQTTKLLRQLGLPGAATVALRVIDPPSRLPKEYLEQLCLLAATGGSAHADLIAMSGSLTRSYIKSLVGQPELQARRMFAIQTLRELPSSETRVMLKEILSANRGVFFLKRENSAVRRVARETLAALSQRGGGAEAR